MARNHLFLTISSVKLKIQNELTQSFPIVSELKQGDSLDPTLFNADDVYILARSILRAKEEFEQSESAASEVRLKVNESKTEYMTQTREAAASMQNIAMGNIISNKWTNSSA